MLITRRYPKTAKPSDFNVSLDGIEMIMEELTPNEAFNRRETERHNIIGGTQQVIRTNYVPRDFTFKTHLLIDPKHPNVYDKFLTRLQNKPVEVISKYMGGKFNAVVIIKKHPNDSPNFLTLDVQVVEIPEKSLIPTESSKLFTNKFEKSKFTQKRK